MSHREEGGDRGGCHMDLWTGGGACAAADAIASVQP
jgi:hypothetical protein